MYSLRTAGRFVSRKKYALDALILTIKELRKVRWIDCFCLAYCIAIPLTIAYDAFEPMPIEHAHAEELQVEATSTPKEALIELTYSKERVKELIAEEFADVPVMMKVAACESGFLQHAYNPTNNSHDGGVFQISEKYHGHRMEVLGLDPYDVKDNITFARILYDESGLEPWKWSKHCWNK